MTADIQRKLSEMNVSMHATVQANAPKLEVATATTGSGNSSSDAAIRFEPVQISTPVAVDQGRQALNEGWKGMVAGDDPAAKYRAKSVQPLEGYNAEKLADPNHKTPKYIFGRVAQNFSLDSVQGDKAKAEELLTAMVPDLRANGLEVVGVKGDRIQVKTEVGYEWVDVVRGAGGTNPGWWWGSEGVGTPQPTSSPKEWAAMCGVGEGGGAPLEGFDMNKLNDPNVRTAKYIFGRVASTNSLDSVTDMASAEELLRKIAQQLQARGLQVLDVKKDKLLVVTERGPEWIDVIRGAGGANPAFQWLPVQA